MEASLLHTPLVESDRESTPRQGGHPAIHRAPVAVKEWGHHTPYTPISPSLPPTPPSPALLFCPSSHSGAARGRAGLLGPGPRLCQCVSDRGLLHRHRGGRCRRPDGCLDKSGGRAGGECWVGVGLPGMRCAAPPSAFVIMALCFCAAQCVSGCNPCCPPLHSGACRSFPQT